MKVYIKQLSIFVALFSLLSCKQEKKEAEVTEEVKTEEVATETASKEKHEMPKPIEPGTKAPDFNLPGVDGKNYTLADFKEYETLVVLFTCNHCPTAQAYEDRFIKIVNDYKGKGVGFVGISPNSPDAISLSELAYSDLGDDLDDMKLRAKQKGYNFPYLYDGDKQETALAYGPLTTPHAFVFDKDRVLKYSGRIDDTENPRLPIKTTDLINTLDAMVAGKEVPNPKTKTFGCSIKWAWKNEWKVKQLADWAKDSVSINDISLAEVGDLMKNNKSKKLRLVNFWATWCGPCVIEFPELVSIDRMYRERDFEFISVSTDKMKQKDKALEMLKKKEASNTNYIYSGKDIYELIEVVDKDWQGSLPYTALIDPDGKILYKVEGTFDSPALKTAIVGHIGRFFSDDEE